MTINGEWLPKGEDKTGDVDRPQGVEVVGWGRCGVLELAQTNQHSTKMG